METIHELWSKIPSAPMYRQHQWSEKDLDKKIPFLQLSATFGVIIFLLERYLDSRQLSRYRNKDAKVPDKRIPEDKFRKSLVYGRDRLSFGMFSSSVNLIMSVALLFLGWLPYAWDLSTVACEKIHLVNPQTSGLFRECAVTSVFVLILTLQSTLFEIPFSLYSAFVIEEKHGFNKQTLQLFFADIFKTLILTFVIGSPVVSGIVSLARLGGPHYYVYVWAFLFCFQLFLMTVYPEWIAPLFNKFSPLDPETHGDLKKEIEALATRVNFPLTKLFVVDGSIRSGHSNAYFYGFFKNKRIVLYDTLLKQVTNQEILAILGHEIGHWALWHTIQGFVIMQAYTFVLFATFAFVQSNKALSAAFGFHFGNDPAPIIIGLTLFTSTYWTPVDNVLKFLLNINSRRNEFAADRYGKKLGYAKDLASGLIKLQIENLGNMVPDPLYSTYHYTHPPLVERLVPLEDQDKKSK